MALFLEDAHTFAHPGYKGMCRSVNIIMYDRRDRWLLSKTKGNTTFGCFKIYNHNKNSPMTCLQSGRKIFGNEFIDFVCDNLHRPSTSIYCMVHKGRYRDYFLLISSYAYTGRLFFWDRSSLWVSRTSLKDVSPDIDGFSCGYDNYRRVDAYGYKDVQILGKDALLCQHDKRDGLVVRVGVIPYDIYCGDIQFIFGINVVSKISDFGGHASGSEIPIEVLKRECIQECGPENTDLIFNSINNSNSGTYVWQARCGDHRLIHQIVLTRVSISEFSAIPENNEILSYEIIPLRLIASKDVLSFHYPIRNFIHYISSSNDLIGYDESCVNSYRAVDIAC